MDDPVDFWTGGKIVTLWISLSNRGSHFDQDNNVDNIQNIRTTRLYHRQQQDENPVSTPNSTEENTRKISEEELKKRAHESAMQTKILIQNELDREEKENLCDTQKQTLDLLF